MTQYPRSSTGPTLTQSAAVMGVVVGVMWVLEFIDGLTGNALDSFGIKPRTLSSLPEIFSAPWLHYGWEHLLSNSLPLFVFGLLILLSGIRNLVLVSLLSAVTSGLLVWLISPDLSVTLGASGVVFGLLTYLLVRGFYTRSWGQLAIAVLVGLSYGGILWGILPTVAGVSWQAHLGGAIGGVLAARMLHREPATTTL